MIARYTDPNPSERLDPATEADDAKVRRHVARYERAIRLAGRVGGVWWDVACGTGYGTRMIAREAANLAIGFDREPPTYTVPGVLVFRAVDLLQIGWTEGASTPDVVLSVETLEHLPREAQQRFVSEIASRMKPDGVFVLACPIGNGPSKTNPYHLHEPTRREVRTMLTRRFRSVRIFAPPFAKQLFAVAREPF